MATDNNKERIKNILNRYKLDESLLNYVEDFNYYPQISWTIREKQPSRYESFLNHHLEYKRQIEQRVLLIHNVFHLLDKEDERIIRKDFIEHDKGWWMDYYSRATYYRHRKRAMAAFCSIYDELVL